MKRGSTPVHVFEVDTDLTGANIYITYEQNKRAILEKSGTDITVTSTTLQTTLTQEETLAFNPGEVLIQIRYVFPDGTADASDIMRTTAERIIKDGVIS